ncbi:Multiple drug resistance-associated protein-like transporter 1 [Seminavis robusta]|uniref:Multiple drug resistance-associated protein-like transporter 1 n=1 Tax=Seminavis robusta TaxID=568900 RepID=A0A9N8HND3_9STRA|nr:Multiple drug resistance-associated protein-like transporter 1 [Seminavis robusta]|eukprot:Sro983_g227840.1 Multiple drug resistance-associated protein-like transporter 1 (1321) ;mRNA; r:30365-34767
MSHPTPDNDKETGESSDCNSHDNDSSTPQPRPANPLTVASQFSKWFFLWAWPLLELGSTRPLQEEDLPHVPEEDSSRANLHSIQSLLHENNNSTTPKSLFRILARHYLRTTGFAQLLLATSMISRLIQVLALRTLLNQLDDQEGGDAHMAYGAAAVMVVCGFVTFTAKQRQFFITYRTGMQLRIGLIANIYHKSFQLPSVNSVSAGQVTNLASNDVERFLMACVTGLYLVYGPLEAMLILGIGVSMMGWSFAAGFGLFMGVLLPLQFHLSHQFATLRAQVAAHTDARVNLISQAITGARVMKMNAWEYPLAKRIEERRAAEVHTIITSCRYKGVNEAVYFCAGLVVSVVIFLVHVLAGGTLSSGIVFSTLTLVNILQHTMTKTFPMAIMFVSESFISCKRIEEFIRLPELNDSKPVLPTSTPMEAMKEGVSTINKEEATTPLINFVDVTCHWNSVFEEDNNNNNTPVVALDQINAEFQPKSLYGIMGTVGSGKSAFLQALVGELPPTSGKIIQQQSSTIAYTSQDPWIMNGSVRDNILMGLSQRDDWYEEVITACALEEDIARFAHGDQTLLGDKGVQCSGGQRARIGLARALYRDSTILVLDDPMSAVDTKVGRWIYQNAIQRLGLDMGKCVILATHQLHFLESATECFLMERGKITCRGNYASCIEAAHGAPLSVTAVVPDEDAHSREEESNNSSTEVEFAEDAAKPLEGDKSMATTNTKSKLGETKASNKEERNTGIVKLSTWIDYFNAMGGLWVAGILVILFAGAQTLSLVSLVAIGKWSEQPIEQQDSVNSISIVVGLTALTVFVALDRALLTLYFFNKAAQRLHDRMTRSVLFSQIQFFDTNPSGRILNRFSSDTGICDEQLPLSFYDCLVGLTMAFGSVCTAIAVLPVILVTLPPLVWYFVKMRNVFVSTTRELKRLEGLARSPIFEMIGEGLNGIQTIRSNGASDYFLTSFALVHDAHTRAFFAFVAASRWFATRLEFVTFFLMAISSFAAALLYDQGWFKIDPAVLGLALTLLLQLAGTNFPWMVRQSAEVVNHMVSVERVTAFGDLPSEAPTKTDFDLEHPDWPSKPSIMLDKLTVRYQKSLPPALQGVTLKIDGGQKVGVVGRTGSGKSTLVQALFRLLEAEDGDIYVDGLNVSRLGLHKLRLAMSVIPQVPILFRGCSVRENLDPFDSYSDREVWEVLEDVQMGKEVRELSGGLHAMVSEGGSNFSVGQRQLLCLARAILRKTSILVLDEATANIDKATEDSLKASLAKNFSEATIIAVAHRLDTVMDYDRILVLGDGEVLEYGSPSELKTKENGHFASLVRSQRRTS